MIRIHRDFISYGAVALFSIALLLYIIPTYSPEYPGYGVPATLVPNVASGAMLLFSCIGIIQTVIKYRKNPSDCPAVHISWKHLAVFFIPCFLLMPAMHHIGFIVSGVAFLLGIQWICGQRSPLPLLLVAVIPVALVYAIMRYGLGVPMP